MLVFIIAVVSADGFIAKNSHHSPATWNSPEDRNFFQQKTKQAGVCIMGRHTYAVMGRPLPDRLNIVYTHNPKSIANSQPLKLDTADKLSKSAESSRTNQTTVNSIADVGPYTTSLPPKNLIDNLRSKNYNQVAVCGGPSIYSLFLTAGLVNKIYLTVEPILFGQGIPLFNQPLNHQLKLQKTHQLSSQTIVLEYTLLSQI